MKGETEETNWRPEEEGKELRVVLLGKTGSGKSSLGNTLLGRDAFPVGRGMSSGTDRCQYASARRQGHLLQVTDTPGVCDTHRSQVEVLQEVGKSLVVSSPGPHVVLMVLRCDRRFTQEEYDAYVALKRLFGDVICSHMILVFVGVDCFGDKQEEQEQGLKREVESSPCLLRDLVKDARGRYCGMNNMASGKARELQACKLLARVQLLVSTNGDKHLCSPLHDDINQLVHDTVMQRMQQEPRTTYTGALRQTKQDVVEDRAAPTFLGTVVDIVAKKVLPVLRTLLGHAVALGATAAAVYCSVM